MSESDARPTVLGRPHVRVDGIAKVTGAATFGSDVRPADLAHAVLVTSAAGPGRIVSIDRAAALAIPGVLDVLTFEDVGEAVGEVKHLMAGGYANSTARPLASDEVLHPGQIVALVAADTLEAAREGAGRLQVRIEARRGVSTLDDPGARARPLAEGKPDLKPEEKDRSVGDVERALAESEVVVDARYATPIQHHNPLELFTTTCVWDGPRLTVHEPTRFVGGVKHGLAAQLGLDPADVRVVAPFIGGHFGSKFGLSQHTALVALAARRIGRPLALHTSRAAGFTIATHRTETRHHVRLGADEQGRLTALFHEAATATSRFDDFAMPGTDVTSALYACPNVRTVERLARVDRNTPGPMRAPPEVPYLFALESAMDELARGLGLDPVELRRRNDTPVDPVSGERFTTRPLVRCLDAAAAAFGWEPPGPPGSRREGDWLVGRGCAAGARPVKTGPATLRLALETGGRARVETAQHEIGNGLYTLLAMAAADGLGVPVEGVEVRLGDSDLPPAGLSGGSSTTTSLADAVAQGCAELRARLAQAAASPEGPLEGADPAGVRLGAGRLFAPDGRSCDLDALLRGRFDGRLELPVEFTPEGSGPDALAQLRTGRFQLATPPEHGLAWAFGAQFAEVRVHALTGEVRVPRLVAAFAAGRVLNPLAARSQLIGGMIWGLGSALLEATDVDPATGRYTNDDLADYLIATSADTPQVTALLVDDPDPQVNPQGVKGLGEIGVIGVNAALANAVFDATGRRVRSLPIRPEHLLAPRAA